MKQKNTQGVITQNIGTPLETKLSSKQDTENGPKSTNEPTKKDESLMNLKKIYKDKIIQGHSGNPSEIDSQNDQEVEVTQQEAKEIVHNQYQKDLTKN